MSLTRPLTRPLTSSITRALTDPGTGGAAFTPLSLYANGEQGAWYDPSDLSTMFQDSAGTTPVTAVEQPDGLILDKRLGAERGPELVVGAATAYTGNGSVSTAGSTVTATCTTDGVYGIRFYSSNVSNKYVECTFEVVTNTAAKQLNFYPNLAHAGVTVGATIGQKRYIVVAPTAPAGNEIPVFFINGLVGESFSVRLVSIKELPGNHALQATSAARPTLSARKNLITRSEELDSASWTKRSGATVVANQGSGAATGFDRITNAVAGNYTGAYVASSMLAANTTQTASVELCVASGTSTAYFYLSAVSGGHTPTIITCNLTTTPQRFTVTQSFSGVASGLAYMEVSPAQNGVPILVGRAMIELGPAATDYQRVNTATDYDTEGFLHYFKTDGVDDGFGTDTFAAGTLTSNMDCFMLVRRDAATQAALIYGQSASEVAALVVSGDGTAAYGNAGAPTYAVNGSTVAATRGALHTALPTANWCVLEIRNLDLSTWTALRFGDLASYPLNGAIAEVILAPAQSADTRTDIREYLAAQGGITL